jgi:hypothetical protein
LKITFLHKYGFKVTFCNKIKPLIAGCKNMTIIEPKCNSFVVYGDNRNSGFKKNIIHRKLLNLIYQQEKDFIINTGDMVFWSLAWKSFISDLNYAKLKNIIYPVRGNHDNALIFRKIFKLEQNYYSIEYGNTLLLILDDNRGILDKKQIKWMQAELENKTHFKWKIVFAHKPLYSGAHRGVRLKLISQLEPLFKKYGVNLFIGSHYHNYERLIANGVTHIVSAGGGASLTKLRVKIPQLIKHTTIHHFLIISVDSEKIHILVYDLNEQIIDKFDII